MNEQGIDIAKGAFNLSLVARHELNLETLERDAEAVQVRHSAEEILMHECSGTRASRMLSDDALEGEQDNVLNLGEVGWGRAV